MYGEIPDCCLGSDINVLSKHAHCPSLRWDRHALCWSREGALCSSHAFSMVLHSHLTSLLGAISWSEPQINVKNPELSLKPFHPGTHLAMWGGSNASSRKHLLEYWNCLCPPAPILRTSALLTLLPSLTAPNSWRSSWKTPGNKPACR